MSLAVWFDGLVTPQVRDRPLAVMHEATLSYGQVHERAWALGSALQRLGVAGERVVTMLPNDPQLLAVQLAILHAGAVAVPVIAEGTPEEMRHFVDDCQAAVVIATPERWAAIAGLVRTAPRVVVLTGEPTVVDPSGPPVRELAQLEREGAGLGLDPVSVAVTDPMAIMYTSGSTSRPKGVVVDAAGFIKDAELQPERFAFAEGENVLGVLQLFHIAGWHQSLAIALGCRGGLMMQRRFSASRFWSDVDASGAVGGLLMPAMLAILLARPEAPDDPDHSLRTVLSHWVDDPFERRFGAEIVPVWGQTELGGLAVSGRAGDRDRPRNCVGLPLPGTEVEIRDRHHRPLPVGAVGEITVRSPWVMQGYWDQPEATAAVLHDGWMSTGDLGYLDERGRLFFSGRLKAMIKRGGENISAVEVEEAICAHPAVAECACYSVPDPILTEEVKVSLVLRHGAAVELEELVAFAGERLARFKVPRYWQVRDDLPRTRSLKVDYGTLVAQHDERPGWDRTDAETEASA
jgi:crotonobetaine/carnitine-CoA ligase